jgi:hypothetical protein
MHAASLLATIGKLRLDLAADGQPRKLGLNQHAAVRLIAYDGAQRRR